MNLIVSGREPTYWENLNLPTGKAVEASICKKEGMLPTDVEFTENSLRQAITNNTLCFTHFKRGGGAIRANAKDGSNVISLDVDNKNTDTEPLTIEDAQKILNEMGINYCIYTTKNHSQALPKYRILIPTKEIFHNQTTNGVVVTIPAHDKIKAYFTKLIPQIDPSCFQPERLFFGNNEAEIYFKNGSAYFDVDSIPEVQTKAINFKNVEDNSFDLSMEIRLNDNSVMKVIDVMNQHTVIFCPFHDDFKNGHGTASAFVEPRDDGGCHIHCSSCSKTWYAKAGSIRNPKNDIKLYINDRTGKITRIDEREIAEVRVKAFKDMGADFKNYVISKLHWEQKNINNKVTALPRIVEIYNPYLEVGYYETNDIEYYNLHRDSKLVSTAQKYSKRIPQNIDLIKKNCPVIYDIIINILDNDDVNMYHLFNWLGALIQKVQRPQTAWIISTKQGSGKDTLFNKIIAPLLRQENTLFRDVRALDDMFNPYEHIRMIGFNETGNRTFLEDKHTIEKLKELITQERRRIRKMQTDEYQVDNYVSYMFFSNSKSPLPIQDNDRRFYYVRAGESKEWFGYWWFKNSKYEDVCKHIDNELPYLAEYLKNIEIDLALITKAPLTKYKSSLIDTNLSAIERLVKAMNAGDITSWDEWEEVEFDSANPRLHNGYNGNNTSNFDEVECRTAVKDYNGIPAKFRKKFLPFLNKNSIVAGQMWRECFESINKAGVGKMWIVKK